MTDTRVRQPQGTKTKGLTGREVGEAALEELRRKWPQFAAFVDDTKGQSGPASPAGMYVAQLRARPTSTAAKALKGQLKGPVAGYVSDLIEGTVERK